MRNVTSVLSTVPLVEGKKETRTSLAITYNVCFIITENDTRSRGTFNAHTYANCFLILLFRSETQLPTESPDFHFFQCSYMNKMCAIDYICKTVI